MKTLTELFFLIACIVLISEVKSQSVSTLRFSLSYDSSSLLNNDSTYLFKDSNKLQIDVLKFYVSNIRFLKNGSLVLREKSSFHLVDASNKSTQLISLPNNENVLFDELIFDLGIDSVTNVSGALGGDLDPTKGMYWTWQSGYINFKLEGTSPLCKTRNNEFQFHLGGYLQPNNCLQTLSFAVSESKAININLNVKEILNSIDLGSTNHIMSPSKEAVLLAKKVANAFTLPKD